MIDRDLLVASMEPITRVDRGFWEGTRAGELRLHASSSGKLYFPQASADADTLATDFHWQKVSGRGKLWSWIVMHQRYLKAYAEAVPYVVGRIELEEGPMIISRLVGRTDDLTCDMPVEVLFEKLDDERTLPVFQVVR